MKKTAAKKTKPPELVQCEKIQGMNRCDQIRNINPVLIAKSLVITCYSLEQVTRDEALSILKGLNESHTPEVRKRICELRDRAIEAVGRERFNQEYEEAVRDVIENAPNEQHHITIKDSFHTPMENDKYVTSEVLPGTSSCFASPIAMLDELLEECGKGEGEDSKNSHAELTYLLRRCRTRWLQVFGTYIARIECDDEKLLRWQQRMPSRPVPGIPPLKAGEIATQLRDSVTLSKVLHDMFQAGRCYERNKFEGNGWEPPAQRGARIIQKEPWKDAKTAQAQNNAEMKRARMLAVVEWYLWHGDPKERNLSRRWNPAGKWHKACTWATDAPAAVPRCSAGALKGWFHPENPEDKTEHPAIAEINSAADPRAKLKHWDAVRDELKRAGLYTAKGWAPKATPETVLSILRSVKAPEIY